ncbi:RNAse P Rpr2/Rpp21/SNM1 subunit domain-containing protein [Daedaleopsis nitida]|nr:RNAse P Rpr2/Rpp21/SNM1 subunit domain-containing protein [Daedaleopsis nitida]
MGKKDKNQEPVANLNGVANRDIIQRINFLYQASTYLNSISTPSTSTVSPRPKGKGKGKSRKKSTIRHPRDTGELSRCYVGSMRIVGQKAMVRMDPSIKRTLCKQCDTVLMPGSTATVRVKPLHSHGHVVVYTCLTCNTSRRIPAPPLLDADPPDSAALPGITPPTSTTGPSQRGDPSAMDADSTGPQTSAGKKNRGPRPRLPPLFERKGHVVFRGDEILRE